MALIAPVWAVDAPVFTPTRSISPTKYTVAITCATSGAEIHYTTNGVEPTVYDPTLTSGGTVEIRRTLTLKAKAWAGGSASALTTGDFVVSGDVSAGEHHMLAQKSTGEVYGWGTRTYGRLANGFTSSAEVLSPAVALKSATIHLTGIEAIAAGQSHSVVLDNAGAVWAFGENTYGAVGNGSVNTSHQPYAVQVVKSTNNTDYLTNCKDVSAGKSFSAALSNDGEVWVWGSRVSHRLSDGDNTGSRRYAGKVKCNLLGNPVLGNPNMTPIKAIKLGDTFALAREANEFEQTGAAGRVWAWGDNANGQLAQGNGTTVPYATPLKLSANTDLTDAWDVSAWGAHIAVIRWPVGDADLQGTVWCCGAKTYGRLGNNGSISGTQTNQTYPVQVLKSDGTPLKKIIQVSVGSAHTLALDEDGHVWSWGYNSNGALGDGMNVHKPHAVQVRPPDYNLAANPPDTRVLEGIARVSAGGETTSNFSTAVGRDGTIYTWGYNGNGELGIGNDDNTAANRLPRVVSTLRSLPNFPDVSITPEVMSQFAPGSATLTAIPSDADGLSNIQKVEFFCQGSLAGTATSAPWKVTLNNLTAGSHHSYAIVTDLQGNTGMSQPVNFTIQQQPDTDGDGLVDAWELQWFGDLDEEAGWDTDKDKISNAIERNLGTNPNSRHSNDGDDMPDDWELFWFGGHAQINEGDADADGISNLNEFNYGTNPISFVDGDDDELPDDWEMYRFEHMNEVADGDPDLDHVSNKDESIKGTDPKAKLDVDNDGLPDDWEFFWFGSKEAQTGADHADADKITNLQEFELYTDPTSALNSDNDGLPDDWEKFWFASKEAQTGAGDADHDTLSNVQEFTAGSDPTLFIDVDDDDMPDVWEQLWFGGPNQLADGDFDDDGVSNLQELLQHTNPSTKTSSDGDGLPDDWETFHFGHPNQNNDGDPDNDHVTNLQEYGQRTNPNSAASNDGDSLPDDWETHWFGNLAQVADGHADGDKITNAGEFAQDTNPTSAADSDGDTLPDDWEKFWFESKVAQAADGNPDQDEWDNQHEFTLGLNPVVALDLDGDGIPYQWEMAHGLDPQVNDADADPDDDKVSNVQEYGQATDPQSAASNDGDGLPDDWETFWFGNLDQTANQNTDADNLAQYQEFLLGLNPLSASTQPGTLDEAVNRDGDDTPDAWEAKWASYVWDDTLQRKAWKRTLDWAVNDDGGNYDQDALSNLAEYLAGTNPILDESLDTDGDGLLDAWEILHFGNKDQLGINDLDGDFDGDGLTNAQELAAGTNPILADTDGDGIPDGSDANPLIADAQSQTATALVVWTTLE